MPDKKTETFCMRVNPVIKRELKMLPDDVEKRMLREIETILAKTCFMHNHYDPKIYGLEEE